MAFFQYTYSATYPTTSSPRRLVRFYSICALLLSAVLSGCVSQSSVDGSSPSVVEGEVFVPDSSSPISSPGVSMSSRAVQNMIDESTKLLDRGEWESAIAMAERGMRIDRRVPELYLVIAKGYAGLQDSARARQFAQQGLLYIDTNSPSEMVDELKNLKAPVPNN